MLNRKNAIILFVIAVLSVSVIAAKYVEPAKEIKLTALLDKVPATTPFVYAFNGPLPGNLAQYLFSQRKKELQELFAGYLEFSHERHEARAKKGLVGSEEDRIITALIHRIQSDFTREGFHRNFGIDLNDEAVLYGDGLIPVFRMVLDNASQLEAAINAVLTEAASAHALAETPNGKLLRIRLGSEVEFVLQIQNDAFALALLPQVSGLAETVLNRHEAETFQPYIKRQLAQLAKNQKYNGLALGLFNSRRFTQLALKPENNEQERARNAIFNLLDLPADWSGCEPFLEDLAEAMPWVHAGILTSSDNHMETQFGMDVSEGISPTLDALLSDSAPSPRREAIASAGIAMHLPVLFEAASDLLAKLASPRYSRCELADPQAIGDYQATLAMLNNPLVNNVTAVLININDFTVAQNPSQTATFSMDALFQFKSADTVVASLIQMSPQLASLGLNTDGRPITMETEVENRTVQMSLAANHTSLAAAMDGPDTASRAKALLDYQGTSAGVLAGYAFRGRDIAAKFATLDNPDNVKTFLSWLYERELYQGVVKFTGDTFAITSYLQFNVSGEPADKATRPGA